MLLDLGVMDVKNLLTCIQAMWKAGNVRAEQEGAELVALRMKLEEALKPKKEEPKEVPAEAKA